MGSVAEFPSAEPDAANHPEAQPLRSHWMVVRNSRVLVGLVFAGCVFSGLLAGCFALIAIGSLLPLAGIDLSGALSAAGWTVAALCTACACPWLWKAGRAMAYSEARLDGFGVDFQFGTGKHPHQCFMPWDRIAFIYELRLGNTTIFNIRGADGSHVTFSSSNFFRPGKLAKLIAAGAGKPIQKA